MPVLRHAGCPESELALIGFLIAAQAQPPQKQAQSPSRSSVDLCSRQRKDGCRNPKMARSIRLLFVYAEELEWRTIPRLFSRVARFHSGKNRDVDLPNRRGKVAGITFWFVSLFPAEKAGLMLPHIERVGQNGLVLDPDNLLVNENAAVAHRFLDFNLPLRSVPHIDRGIGLANRKCLPQKCLIERTQRLGFLLVSVAPLPVLILAGKVLRGMVLCIVGDQIWRVGSA